MLSREQELAAKFIQADLLSGAGRREDPAQIFRRAAELVQLVMGNHKSQGYQD